MGDGTDDAPANAALSQLPSAWLKKPGTPAKRHLDGINVAFVDGHVKWYRPEKVTELSPKAGRPTFRAN